MPHKHRAHFDIDTFLAYEPSVYRAMLLPELEKEENLPLLSGDYDALIATLRGLTPLDNMAVPTDSLVREFIGGSSFNY